MKKYLFQTKTAMKEYNVDKYFIDRGIIKKYVIEGETVTEALNKYVEKVNNEYYNIISKNAVKNKCAITEIDNVA